MTLEHKTFPVAEFKVVDKAKGEIEAYVAVFNNEDLGGDTVEYGFFTDSIKRKYPVGVWMHDWSQPVAKTLEAEEVPPRDPRLPEKLAELGGLRIKGLFNLNTQRGKDAFSDIEFGIIDEFSFGYDPIEYKMDHETGKRRLIKGEIFEWSPVLVGMNPATQLLSVKGRTGDDLPFTEHLELAVDVCGKVAERASDRHDRREKVGRELSSGNREMLSALATSLQDVLESVSDLLARTDPDAGKDDDKSLIDMRAEQALFYANRAAYHQLQKEFTQWAS